MAIVFKMQPRKTHHLAYTQWQSYGYSTAGRKAFVRGLAKKEALRIPNGVHDFQAEPQWPVLQPLMLWLLWCPHWDDHPGDLIHGGQPVDGNSADCGGNTPKLNASCQHSVWSHWQLLFVGENGWYVFSWNFRLLISHTHDWLLYLLRHKICL